MLKKSPYIKILFFVKVTIAAIVFWMLARYAQLDVGLIYDLFDRPSLSLAVILLFLAMVVVNAWRWQRLISVQRIYLPFSQTLLATYLGVAFNNVLPGNIGGDFFRLYYVLKKFPSQKQGAILSVVLDRISGLMGIFIIACLIAPFYLEIFAQHHALFNAFLMCLGICVFGLVIFLISTLLLYRKGGLTPWVEKKISQSLRLKPLLSLLEAIHLYRNSKITILESLLGSITIQLLLLVVVLILNKVMNLPVVSPLVYLLALAFGQVANLLPLTPGGIGIGEAAFANLILIFNPGVTGAFATVFLALRLLSIVTYLPAVAFGIFGFSSIRKLQPLMTEGENS